MKKVFLVLGLLTIGLVSCDKDYTCECNQYDETTLETIEGTTEKSTISASNKEAAVEECLKKGINETKSCLIK